MKHLDRVFARYNSAGHTQEWIVLFPGWDHDNYIPNQVADRFETLVQDRIPDGQATVSNRGSRLEINSSVFTYTDGRLAEVTDALRTLIAGLPDGATLTLETEVVAWEPPAPAAEPCRRGCGEMLTGIRAQLDHFRSAHAA